MSRAKATRTEVRIAWIALVAGLVWTVLIRLPLILHAEQHLDSDLAVDGLVLIDSLGGQWRWHYPGTPHIGIAPVLLSLGQGLLLGPTAEALVSGGTVAWIFVIVTIFCLCWRLGGPSMASWSLIPLVFSNVGLTWLSSRITGGHLLAVAWHAAALWGFHACLTRTRFGFVFLLGLWCGLGWWHDSIFLFSILGIGLASAVRWWSNWENSGAFLILLTFLLGLVPGITMKQYGTQSDPHNAYGSQFETVLDASILQEHSAIYAGLCVPRLVSGHTFPRLVAEPSRIDPIGRPIGPVDLVDSPSGLDRAATMLGIGIFVLGVLRVAWKSLAGWSVRPESATCLAMLGTFGLVSLAFVVNRNIYNSDNYRYLVFGILPFAVGFGLLSQQLARVPRVGILMTSGIALIFAVVFTWDLARWYQGLGWLKTEVPENKDLALIEAERAGATHLFGDYWVVYRASFLSGGTLVGVPYPTFPNRFQDWSEGLGVDQGGLLILERRKNWQPMLRASWEQAQRDPREWNQLTIMFPEPIPGAP